MEQMTIVAPQNTEMLPKLSCPKVKAISLFSEKEQEFVKASCATVAVTDGQKQFLVQPEMQVPKHYEAARQSDGQIYGTEKVAGG